MIANQFPLLKSLETAAPKTASASLPVARRGTPEISEFNRNPFKALGKSASLVSRPSYSLSAQSPSYSQSVDTAQSFMNSSATDTIASTCRKVVTSSDSKTLYVYVADDCWGTGTSKANYVTQAMVDTLAAKFLIASGTTGSGSDDIFHWVTNIFGANWGANSYPSDLIGSTNEITILLCDIDGDNSIIGGTLGFFWSKDALLPSAQCNFTNQRMMLYIDAVMFATKDSSASSWDLTSYWPAEIVSTLSHEFQHMIHFYQKAVLRNAVENSDTWIDEMCSMMTEDLVSDKIQVNGPRSVSYSDGSAGTAPLASGRISLFNYNPEWPVASWTASNDTTNNVLYDYANKYVLGAYYGRNYGGASFFRNIVQNDYTDYRAVEHALIQAGYTGGFAGSLRQFFIASLLSDKTDAAAGYLYNKGDWFTSTINAITYKLGSINLFNYYQYTCDNSGGTILGMKTHSSSDSVTLKPSGSYIVKAGTSLTGSCSWNVTLKTGVKMAVVVK